MDEPRPAHVATSYLFLRLLGLVYLVAFVSAWVQVDGLFGASGIAPVRAFLDWLGPRLGPERFWRLPTVFWLGASDTALHLVCATGVVASLLVVFEVAPALGLLAAWTLYLSLVSVGQEFMAFQWDSLLLESGFLAIFLSPWSLRPARGSPFEPPPLVRWLLVVLLFRLMFSSGVVKLTSGDPAWRSLDALRFHYETQPLPTWLGWYAHQLPAGAQRFSAAAMFVIEILAPFSFFGPRRLREVGLALTLLLQAAISLTGNYTFFNLLTAALCLQALDDRSLGSLARRLRTAGPSDAAPSRRCPRTVAIGLAVLLGLLSLRAFGSLAGVHGSSVGALVSIERWAAPFDLVNRYGLFAVMTTRRVELVVEGSDDGEVWRPYLFRYKPQDLERAPGYVEPHQPRLDWQMWFAALGSCDDSPWLMGLFGGLLKGSRPVLGLLANDPFPGRAPRFVRASAFEYHFTTLAERRSEGRYWRREPLGSFCAPVSLREPTDAAARRTGP